MMDLHHEMHNERLTLTTELFQAIMSLLQEMFRIILFPKRTPPRRTPIISKEISKTAKLLGKSYQVNKNRINQYLTLIEGDPDTFNSEVLKQEQEHHLEMIENLNFNRKI